MMTALMQIKSGLQGNYAIGPNGNQFWMPSPGVTMQVRIY